MSSGGDALREAGGELPCFSSAHLDQAMASRLCVLNAFWMAHSASLSEVHPSQFRGLATGTIDKVPSYEASSLQARAGYHGRFRTGALSRSHRRPYYADGVSVDSVDQARKLDRWIDCGRTAKAF